jgi:5-methylcytosine-specific restriction endonuclease McrA
MTRPHAIEPTRAGEGFESLSRNRAPGLRPGYFRVWVLLQRRHDFGTKASVPYSDPEKRRAYQRGYIKRTWLKHLEHSKEAMRRWRANNPEKRLARDRAYRIRHPDQQIIYQRQWIRNHPDVRKAKAQVRRAREIGALGRFTAAEWRSLTARYDAKCAYCGADAPLEADHRTPLSRGGANSIDNILPACGPCNRKKRTMTEAEFRRSIEGDLGAA